MIEVDGLTMHYGPVVALDNASFKVKKGEVVGLLGPNGAGKSTTMKILTTYLYPTAGKASIGGMDVVKNPLDIRRITGYLPEILPLYMDMELRDYLRFVASARGVRRKEMKRRLEWVVEHCGLKPMYRKIIRELSKGYKQRTGLAQALVHDPEVVILDEPTSGLDPHQILEIRKLIRKLAKKKTIILSTHILREAEAVSDRIVIINNGKIVGDGTIDKLRQKVSKYERTFASLKAPSKDVEKALEGMDNVINVKRLKDDDGYMSFEIDSDPGVKLWRQIGELAHNKGWEVGMLKDSPMDLEETFLALTESKDAKGV